MNKKHLLVTALLAFATTAFAQHDEQVTVEGTYRPKVNKVNKLQLKPKTPSATFSMPNAEVQPMETERRFNLELDKINPLPLSSKNNAGVTPVENFLMAGLGTRISPLFLFRHNSMLSKNTGVGVGLRHFSSWMNMKDYAPSGFMNNAFDVSVTTKEFDNLQIGGRLYYKNDVCHYYGVNLVENPIPQEWIEAYCPRQTYNMVGAKFGLQTASSRLGEFAHHADFDYHYLFDKVYAQSEHSARLDYGLIYSDNWWGSKDNPQRLGADLTAHYVSRSKGILLKLNPYFEMKGGFYRLRAGFKLHVTPSDRNDNQFLVCPDLKGSLFVLDRKLEFYANLGGGQKMLTFSEIVAENPFVGEWQQLYNQSVKLDFEGGVRTNILQAIDLHLGVRYRHADKDLFYATLFENGYNASSEPMPISAFAPVTDETKTVSVVGEVRWLIVDNLSADMNLAYSRCTPTLLLQPLYRPAFEGKLKLRYDVGEQLTLKLTALYQGGRFGMGEGGNLHLLEQCPVVKLNDVIDIALSADYKINDRIAVFAKLDNLLHCQYQLYYNYPVTGIQLFAGLKMAF